MNVVVLGGSGMLGSMVVDVLRQDPELKLCVTSRDGRQDCIPDGIQVHALDASVATKEEIAAVLDGAGWAINCIGVIKHLINDANAADVERAIRVNSLFPHNLAAAAAMVGCKVLQIATDCVFSGEKGGYIETDPHDALDAYGKSKSLGEVSADGFYNLRCSIIGPELREYRSLLEWFLRQPSGAAVTGFTNHLWNGVTTLHFAKICRGVIRNSLALPRLAHVIPGDVLSKGDLLSAFAVAFGRKDLVITPKAVQHAVDRSLGTLDASLNLRLWQAGGYVVPPTLGQMVDELAGYRMLLQGGRS
ncbi:sugar nucleotide-binding protein [Mesoterricola sediminis]|uniref:dTDP-4-dehydrorhamnose reductase n=1 Tax=Mesoterricola sediminis TaxID=2927980 RepID=A0AA48GWC0_9BACT|nr:sugar nucleotide-binding protein [Mesoterricola sediminis]BDU75287.1 NAD(P)-dependent oxidoreductase [Mesoterricola sediminis]